jgi:hypothetical protein
MHLDATMAISDERIEQFQAEVQRRIALHLEHRRDTAPDGPGLDLEDYRALEQGFAWEIVHEPGWEDVQSLWKDAGTYKEYEEMLGRRP